jgi:hypothetical protein
MTSLALPFRTVMDKNKESMLQERELRRTVSIFDLEGDSKYSKGTVEEDGFVKPLTIQRKDQSLINAFIEETEEEKELQDILLMPLERSTNEDIVNRLSDWYARCACKDHESQVLGYEASETDAEYGADTDEDSEMCSVIDLEV